MASEPGLEPVTLGSDARAEIQRWALCLEHSPHGGVAGNVLGRSSGASMEFHDRRSYTPGDDVRHLDWRAYARTDELLVRVHREEVAPRLDLFVDLSLSMATDPAKARRAVELAGLLIEAARAAGHSVRLVTLGEDVVRLPVEAFFGDGLRFDARRPLSDQVGAAGAQVRPSSIRAVISDFLVPQDPAQLVRPFTAGAARTLFLQILSETDVDPTAGLGAGTVRLVDSETNEPRDVELDSASVRRYRERLERLQAGLAGAARGTGGVFRVSEASGTFGREAQALAELGVIEAASG